jgi:hypothetical protein
MKHTTEEYSSLLNGRLPSSSLEFELCDMLIELQKQVKNLTPDVIKSVCPTCNKVENVFCSNAWHILNEKERN